MKNSLHWYPSPCIKTDYKIGLLGELWADVWFALWWSLFFFRVMRQTEYISSCVQTLPLYKNASALVVTESDEG